LAATLTTLNKILKEFYLPPVVDQLNNNILLPQLLEVDKENIQGLKAFVPLHYGRSGGIGSRPELGTIPASTNQSYNRAAYDLKYHYARVSVSGPSIFRTESEAGAFLQAMKSELDYIKNDLMYDFARQMYGDGTAQITPCIASGPSTTVTLGSGAGAGGEAVTKGFLYVGLVIDIGTAAAPTTIVAATTITDVNPATPSITIGTSVTTTTSHFIFRAGNTTGTANIFEMDAGLQALIPTAANTIGGIDASAAGNRWWDNLRDTAGGALTVDNMLIDWNKALAAGAQVDKLLVLGSLGLQRVFFNGLKSLVQYIEPTKIRGGYEYLEFQGVKVYGDRLAPWGKLYFVDQGHIKLFSPADWDFLARDGQAVKWVQDQDAFQSVLFRYANLGADRRNTLTVMSGLTDTGF
jgi:hypothetical protein